MKQRSYYLLGIYFSILAIIPAAAQDVTGTWQGRLFFRGKDMRIVFHIKNEPGTGLVGTSDSPDQGTKGIKIDDIVSEGDSLYIYIASLGGEYNGTYNKDSAAYYGHLKQGGIKLPLKLIKGEADDLLYHRPQKPVKPYPYYEEEVTIINRVDGDTLSGTFTRPNGTGKYPVAILISGSGPEDRDETVFAHKPFLLLSDYLTRKGFAVLRCDDRGTAKSTGDFGSATTADFSRDIEAQLDYLEMRPDVDKKKIGLIGHSEGGVIAPMVAVARKEIAFVVLMAAPSVDMFDLLLIQDSLISAADGESPETIRRFVSSNQKLFSLMKSVKDSTALADSIDQHLTRQKTPDKLILASIQQLTSAWMRWYVGFDPRVNLEKLHCPVLAINGERDIQVPAEIDIRSIEECLLRAKNKNFKTEILPGLNHLFQHCKKCSFSEYGNIDETMNQAALAAIGEWMEKNVPVKK